MQPFKFFKNLTTNFIIKRSIKREIRAKLKERRSGKNLALEYFDFYYAPLFGAEWSKLRLALLTGRKYTALVNNYSDWKLTEDILSQLSAVNMFESIMNNKLINNINNENNNNEIIKIPKTLKVFTFDNGDASEFPSPPIDSSGKSNYYCLDGASVLSVIALDIQKDDYILDLCASPGGKTLVMLQTLLPKQVVATDITTNRLARLNRTLSQFLHDDDIKRLLETGLNLPIFKHYNSEETFNKVLVDVPCSNDRHSLFQIENNIFSKPRQDERSDLPRIQTELLIQAIKACQTGGTVVYSTCTLSPLQNEAVVKESINHFSEQPNNKFKLEIESLDYLKKHFDYYFQFSDICKIGALIIPSITKNFGPIYICKISKNKSSRFNLNNKQVRAIARS